MDFNLRLSFSLAALSVTLLSCGSNSSAPTNRNEAGSHDSSPPCASGLAAFETNIYKPILRTTCLDCHDAAGPGPAHSTIDPAASYAMIKTYVNFGELSQSRI